MVNLTATMAAAPRWLGVLARPFHDVSPCVAEQLRVRDDLTSDEVTEAGHQVTSHVFRHGGIALGQPEGFDAVVAGDVVGGHDQHGWSPSFWA